MADNNNLEITATNEKPNTPESNTKPITPETDVPLEKTYTQSQLDSELIKTRHAAEKTTEKQLLALLGIDSKDKLANIKKAYEDSLTAEEKLNNDLKLWQDTANKFKVESEEKDYIIVALSAMTDTALDKIQTIVKMAKGLKDENTSIEDAVKTVLTMLTPTTDTKSNLPVSVTVVQPETPPPVQVNPFKQGEHFSLTAQGKLFREDPIKANQLAKEAGFKINY